MMIALSPANTRSINTISINMMICSIIFLIIVEHQLMYLYTKLKKKMFQTDLIIHDEKDNVAVVVIDKTSKDQECV